MKDYKAPGILHPEVVFRDEVFELSEPEFVGPMPVRVELFSEPFRQKPPSGVWRWGDDGDLVRVGGRHDGLPARAVRQLFSACPCPTPYGFGEYEHKPGCTYSTEETTMIEVAVVVDAKHEVLCWHAPADASGAAIPDSQDLWQLLWDRRADVLGSAHVHPWHGEAWPSHTDITTFRAVELGLGKTLVWWVVTFSDVTRVEWSETRQAYELHQAPDVFPWLAELRARAGLRFDPV